MTIDYIVNIEPKQYSSIVNISQIDKSINLIQDRDYKDLIETRFVRKDEHTAIIYLSSANGCNQACRFCYLTQMGHTFNDLQDIVDCAYQVKSILDTVKQLSEIDNTPEYDLTKITTIHFNFMARGDILLNFRLVDNYQELVSLLDKVANTYIPKVKSLFKISTIFPSEMPYETTVDDLKEYVVKPLLSTPFETEIYYSLYSLKKEFRKKWMPKSLNPELIGEVFRNSDKGFRLHYALIKDQNDSEEDIALILDWLERYNIETHLNLIRYNPFSDKTGEETDKVTFDFYRHLISQSYRIGELQVINKRGPDVNVSCGMFTDC